eukprot:3860490-Prymnesium_polylepis.1
MTVHTQTVRSPLLMTESRCGSLTRAAIYSRPRAADTDTSGAVKAPAEIAHNAEQTAAFAHLESFSPSPAHAQINSCMLPSERELLLRLRRWRRRRRRHHDRRHH